MRKIEHEVRYRKLAELHELEGNPRTIKKQDMERLKKSIRDNQDYFEARPIILSDRTGKLVIIAGNQRYRAARELGLDEVPTVLLSGLDEKREREIIIRDNVENGEWDMDALANEWDIEELQEWGVEDVKPYQEIIEDEPDPVDEENTYSIVGDIYQLGEHRIFCGSFEDDEKIRKLFGDKKATCTFTDPPYNVAYEGKTSAKLKIQNDKKSAEEFANFLNRAMACIVANTEAGGGVICWMAHTELPTLWSAMVRSGMRIRQYIVWVKNTMTLGHQDFQFQTEPAIYGIPEGKYNDIEDDEADCEIALYHRATGGKFNQNRTVKNAWFFPKPTSSREHPTMKPVGLCAKGVLSLSEPGDIVFDPFSGSGSTLIACEQTGRRCYGCEIDPKYCDVIRKRWVKFTTGSEDNWQRLTPTMERS